MDFAQIKVPENLKPEKDICAEIIPVKSSSSELKESDDAAGSSTSNSSLIQKVEKRNAINEDCFSQDSGVGSSQELVLSSQESILPSEDVVSSSQNIVLSNSSQDVLSDVLQDNQLKDCYLNKDDGSFNNDIKPLLKSQIKFTNAISKKRRYSEGDCKMNKKVEIDFHDEISFSSLKHKLNNCSSSESTFNDEKHNKMGKRNRDYSDDDAMTVEKKQKMSKLHEFTITSASSGESRVDISDNKQKCIICVSAFRDSAFMHGRDGHMSCCYRCSMNTWKEHKRCPICNRKVRNVVRIYQA